MAERFTAGLYQRKSLDQITAVPDSIISVYVIEKHIWADDGGEPGLLQARKARRANPRTVDEFLIQPVRGFLNDIFRQMAAPYDPAQKERAIGQGYWVQAEFGSGKSHLLSFVGALALGDEAAWNIVRRKEQEAGQGRRESLYSFYEEGLARKQQNGKGILVAVKTLVGEGGGAIGMAEHTRSLTEYILDAVAEQFFVETGRALPLYPSQLLVERFLATDDLNRYQRDLARFLKDPAWFDDEEQQELADFMAAMKSPDPNIQRDVGERLWRFYEQYLRIRPQIPMEAEPILEHMVNRLLDEGYAGLLLILDEISLFMKGRSDAQRVEDEKTLVVLANRLAKVKHLPVWVVCAAQEKLETKMAGVKNILARERLDPVPLLSDPAAYATIALHRVRTITEPGAIDPYYEDYKRSFSWPQAIGKSEFARFFPFFPPSLDIMRAISYNLTTVRSALYFMLETLKTQRKRQSREVITLWALFEGIVKYEEDPSGTTRGVASIKVKWPDVWHAYETARAQLDAQVRGPLMLYRQRADKIIKTLFLYHIADRAPNGLSAEELMNSVMEWRDHDKGQTADLQDNLDHYTVLCDQIALEIAQVERVGANYRFRATSGYTQPSEHFQRARAEVEQSQQEQRVAWEALLALDGWEVSAQLMKLNLGQGIRSVFRAIAPAAQTDVTLKWHGREISGRVFMRDLLSIARQNHMLPSINSTETGLDFAVFISSTPVTDEIAQLIAARQEPRAIFWAPDPLSASERDLLIDFGAYRKLVAEFAGRDSEEARAVLEWVQHRLRDQMGSIYRIVPGAYSRGVMAAANHQRLDITVTGELTAFLTPVVGQVLDSVYISSELEFTAPAPFNDANAINVINGIVKVGEIERGAKPNRDISAAQNYGFDLRIMRRPHDRKLDLTDCRYTRAIATFLEDKLGASGAEMPVVTLYKNFMGIGGPGDVNYGLSKRMVQLYLLCLVREGKVRIGLSPRAAPLETIDYGNIASIDFKTAVLDAFERVQLVAAPEGWELLAPYAAVLLDDPSVTAISDEADIQGVIQRLLRQRDTERASLRSLTAELAPIFAELGYDAAEFSARLAQWQRYLDAHVDVADAITGLRIALDRAFDYEVYAGDRVAPDEVDDLKLRRDELRQLEQFARHGSQLRAIARYVRAELPAASEFDALRAAFAAARAALISLPTLIASEARLTSELLDPMREAISSYAVRYLQRFDRVTARAEEVRQLLHAAERLPDFVVLETLAGVTQLGADGVQTVRAFVSRQLDDAATLRPARITRGEAERALNEWPQPSGCEITLSNADEWMARLDAVAAELDDLLRQSLHEKAAVLASSALRDRLQQHADAPFIRSLLAAPDAAAVADALRTTIGAANDADRAAMAAALAQALRQVVVKRLRLADFKPTRRTLERTDIEDVVAEFRTFLTGEMTEDRATHTVLELE